VEGVLPWVGLTVDVGVKDELGTLDGAVLPDGTLVDSVDPLLGGKLLDTDVLGVEVLGVVWVLGTLVDGAELDDPEVPGVSVEDGGNSL